MPRQVYELTITLKHLDPPVWRKVLVDPDIRLDALHEIIQVAMGWEDAHLHAFHNKGRTFMIDPEDDFGESDSELDFTLRDLAPHVGDHIEYEYDFGDGWQHEIKVTGVLEFGSRMQVPSVIEGENACPPEDCGGVWGYLDMLKAFSDSHHPEHDEVVDWLGEEFDPLVFDLEAANTLLGEVE